MLPLTKLDRHPGIDCSNAVLHPPSIIVVIQSPIASAVIGVEQDFARLDTVNWSNPACKRNTRRSWSLVNEQRSNDRVIDTVQHDRVVTI